MPPFTHHAPNDRAPAKLSGFETMTGPSERRRPDRDAGRLRSAGRLRDACGHRERGRTKEKRRGVCRHHGANVRQVWKTLFEFERLDTLLALSAQCNAITHFQCAATVTQEFSVVLLRLVGVRRVEHA